MSPDKAQDYAGTKVRYNSGSVNDPSAGSPTETLLRLLLPLSDMVYLIFRTLCKSTSPKGSPDHSNR